MAEVQFKAIVELTKSEDVKVELSQASLSSHQSNWKVKSRAQATEKCFYGEIELVKPTFHNAELVVEQVGLVDCKNQTKLLGDM